MLKVVNKNNKPYTDSYLGVSYTFMPNETVLIPEEAGRHIFGYGLEKKNRQYVRMGLIEANTQRFLHKFEVSVNVVGKKEEPETGETEKVNK